MKSLLRIIRRTALYLSLCLTILLALTVTVLRFWVFPEASEYRRGLETQIGSLIGETVRIEGLSARLRGFHPVLSVDGFHILDAQGQSAIRFATVRLDLDPLRTLLTGLASFDRFEIVGAKLSIRRKQDGTLGIAGLHVHDQPPAWLMADGHFELLDCELDWQDLQQNLPPLPLGKANIRLVNNNGKHRLGADIAPPPSLGQSFRLVLVAEGNLFRAEEWSGTLYLEGKHMDMARIADVLPASNFAIKSGLANFELWGHWAGRLDSVTGDIALANLLLAIQAGAESQNQLALTSLEGRFRWQQGNDGWRLDLDRFRPALTNAWPETQMALALTRRADGTVSAIRAAASYLELGEVDTVLHAFPLLDEKTGEILKGLQPRGTLRNVRFYFAPNDLPGERLALCGTFDDFGSNPWESFPGVYGLNGTLCGTDGAGRISVSAENGTIQPAAMGLKNPIQLTKAAADLSWQQTDTDWLISSRLLSLENADLTAHGRFSIVLPKKADSSPFLDLRVRLGETPIAGIKQYLPFAIAPETSRQLETALIGGQIRSADLLFHGAIADFPFHRNDGVFQASVDAQDLAFRFHPDWPPLTQTNAAVRFYGPGLELALTKGRIGQGEIVKAHAEAEDLKHSPQLKLSGNIQATVPDILDFLAHTPLREIPAGLGKFVTTAGNTDISLNLAIPLDRESRKIEIDGQIEFKDAKLHVGNTGVELQHINGPLRFTRSGMSADAIRASVFDHPAFIRVSQERAATEVEIKGIIGVSDLREQVPGDFWRFARGSTDYRLGLRIPKSLDGETDPLALSLSSTMTGVALDLPAPLGKREKAKKNLYIETTLRAGSKVPLQLHYGHEVTAKLRFSEPDAGFGLEGGSVGVGRLLPPITSEPGLAIAAQLDELDAAAWRRLLLVPSDEPSSARLLRKLDLNVGTLYWDGDSLGSLSLDMTRENEDWRGYIDSAYGRGSFKKTADLMAFDLEYLKLPKLKAAKAEPGSADTIDPSTVPNIELSAKRLVWENTDFGPFVIRTQRHAHGMTIKALSGGTKNHRFDVQGSWTRSADQTVSTRLQGKLHIENLGKLLSAIGYAGEVRDTASDIDFALSWPGGPWQFARESVTGDIRTKLGKGAILKVEPGLGRVLGMLNLSTLWRRLSFDFSDLFGEGLAYDSVMGTFRLGGGQAVTKGFLIDAVPAKIVIDGRAGLVARDLDQIVTVIPRTSVALPIAGALAGGPAVGAAVLLAQQLVGEEVDSITATQYAVKGSWDEPEITKISRNLPLDLLDRAWSGMKDLSGFGNETETNTNE